MMEREQAAAERDHRHHRYRSNRIPWWVRLIWIGFWVFAIYYTVKYVVPTMQLELFSKP
ncbi:MAG: hypothetical protein RIS70_3424 [Planctomycetota bacterium]